MTNDIALLSYWLLNLHTCDTEACRATEMGPPPPVGVIEPSCAELDFDGSDEVTWRERAKTTLLPGLQAYEAAIRNTIGLRLQSRLSREQALDMASCTSGHRDISLHF